MPTRTQTACPFCGFDLPAGTTTCPRCNLPLAAAVEPGGAQLPPPLPEYCKGRLIQVTTASHQAEAELIEGMLRSVGIPCVIKRSIGADVPDFLSAGPRGILVPESGYAAAREMLQMPPAPPPSDMEILPNPLKLVLAILICAAMLIALIAYLFPSI